MKYFIISFLLISPLTHASIQEFNNCTSLDIEFLRNADVIGNQALADLIDDESMKFDNHCTVSKPRNIHPAVCGIFISQLDTYILKSSNSTQYKITVDSSYIACQSKKIIPTITSFKYTHKIKRVSNTDSI